LNGGLCRGSQNPAAIIPPLTENADEWIAVLSTRNEKTLSPVIGESTVAVEAWLVVQVLGAGLLKSLAGRIFFPPG